MSGTIQELRLGAGQAWKRFFAALLCAWATGVTALTLSIGDFYLHGLDRFLDRIPWCLALGIPLFIGLQLVKTPSQRWRSWALILGASALALFCVWSMEQEEDTFFLRYFFLSVAVHLFAGFAPFFGSQDEMRLWSFNRALLSNLFTTWFFGLFLWGGLSLLLWLGEMLFGLKTSHNSSEWVFLGVMFFFQPWHFCSRIPDPKDKGSLDPGRAMVFFSRYIMVPLIFLHGVGLIAYMGLAALTRSWPKPESAVLVGLHAGFGLLSLVLVWPLARQKKSWAWYYQRSYYLLTPLLLLLLFVGRIHEALSSGLEPETYGGLVAASVTLVLSLSALARPKLNLRWIPLSFMVAALVLAAGPVGALEMALRQQKTALKAELQKSGLFSEKGLQAATQPPSFKERAALSRRLDKAYKFLGQTGVALVLGYPVERNAEEFLEARKIRYVSSSTEEEGEEKKDPSEEHHFGAPENELMPLFGKAYLLEPRRRFIARSGFVPLSNTVSVHFSKNKQALLIYLGDKVVSELDLKPPLKRLRALPDVRDVSKEPWRKKERHWKDLVLAQNLPRGLGTLVASSVTWKDEGEPQVTGIQVKLFVDKAFDVDGRTSGELERQIEVE